MIIVSHKHNFIYLRPPKTGSSSTQFTLRLCDAWGPDDILSESQAGQFGVRNFVALRDHAEAGTLHTLPLPIRRAGPHATLDQMYEAGYITKKVARTYDSYAFLRNPYQRFISGLRHKNGRVFEPYDVFAWSVKVLTGEGIGEENDKYLGLLTVPQSNYYKFEGKYVVNILDFREFEAGVRTMLDRVGGIQFPIIPKMNMRSTWKDSWTYDDFWTEETLQLFEADYAEDIDLYVRMYGKDALKRPTPKAMKHIMKPIEKSGMSYDDFFSGSAAA